ncbi:amino acid ABC transporter permease [Alcaligenaceae bacterium]|nr:amino acid ABC transporter permease [Alcaligenaceae bacterium]
MEKIIHYFFNWSLVKPYIPDMLHGLLITIQMAVLTIAIGLVLGLALALLRCYRALKIEWLIILFVDVFRALPQLVIIVLFFYALPMMGIVLNPFVATVLALTLVLAAFSEEIFWGAIGAVSKGQWEAARSTGLGFTSTLCLVILPQALRLSVPQLTNRCIAITKGTSLGAVIAVPELLNVTMSTQSMIANPSILTLSAVFFCAIFFPFIRLTRWIEKKYSSTGF